MLDNSIFALTILLVVIAVLTAASRLQNRQAGKRLLVGSRYRIARSLLLGLGVASVFC